MQPRNYAAMIAEYEKELGTDIPIPEDFIDPINETIMTKPILLGFIEGNNAPTFTQQSFDEASLMNYWRHTDQAQSVNKQNPMTNSITNIQKHHVILQREIDAFMADVKSTVEDTLTERLMESLRIEDKEVRMQLYEKSVRSSTSAASLSASMMSLFGAGDAAAAAAAVEPARPDPRFKN